jgi:hypothetical protein
VCSELMAGEDRHQILFAHVENRPGARTSRIVHANMHAAVFLRVRTYRGRKGHQLVHVRDQGMGLGGASAAKFFAQLFQGPLRPRQDAEPRSSCGQCEGGRTAEPAARSAYESMLTVQNDLDAHDHSPHGDGTSPPLVPISRRPLRPGLGSQTAKP